MLKIKEFHKDGTKVDLKELEKFGFNEENTLFLKIKDKYEVNEVLTVDKKTKEIEWNTYEDLMDLDWVFDTIFDLIQADLVEKVEE